MSRRRVLPTAWKPPPRGFSPPLEPISQLPRAVLLDPSAEDPELRELISPADNGGSSAAPTAGLCQVCGNAAARYSCPNCNRGSCGLDCFRRHGARCTDLFHSRALQQELRAQPPADPEQQQRMREILARVHAQQQQQLSEHPAAEGDDADHHDDEGEDPNALDPELAEELQRLSLLLASADDSLEGEDQDSAAAVALPSLALRQRFEMYLRQGGGEGGLVAGALQAWRPWWWATAGEQQGDRALEQEEEEEPPANSRVMVLPAELEESPESLRARYLASGPLLARLDRLRAATATLDSLNADESAVVAIRLLLRQWPRRDSLSLLDPHEAEEQAPPPPPLQDPRKLLPGLAALLIAYAHVHRSWTGAIPDAELPQAVRVLLCLPGIFETDASAAAMSLVNHGSVPEMLHWLLEERFGCRDCASAAGCIRHPYLQGATPGHQEEDQFGMTCAAVGWTLDCVADSVRLLERPELLRRALAQIRRWLQRVPSTTKEQGVPRRVLKRAVLKLDFLSRAALSLYPTDGGHQSPSLLQQLQEQLMEGWVERLVAAAVVDN